MHRFRLFADYFQFYLIDNDSEDDASDIWSEFALKCKLALASRLIAIGTLRNVEVDVEVEVLATEPEIDLADWDHAARGYFTNSSGLCAVLGCTDYLPDAKRIHLTKGDYAVLSCAKGWIPSRMSRMRRMIYIELSYGHRTAKIIIY